MPAAVFRRLVRSIHLVVGALAGFFLYAQPLFTDATARAALAYGVVPLLGVTGLMLWQQPKVMRLLRRAPSPGVE